MFTGFKFGDEETASRDESESTEGVLNHEARGAAEKCFAKTVKTEFGDAKVAMKEWQNKHPRMTLEEGHLRLIQGTIASEEHGYQAAMDIYLRAAEHAEGVETVYQEPIPSKTDEGYAWSVWAQATAQQLSGLSPPPRSPKHTPAARNAWRPLKALPKPCPCAQPLNREHVDVSLLRIPPRADTLPQLRESPAEEEIPIRDEPPTLPTRTFTGTPIIDRAPLHVAWSDEARSLSDAIEDETLISNAVEMSKEMEHVCLGAEARAYAGLLQLKSAEYINAGSNLRRAWLAYQPLRKAVHSKQLPDCLEDDVKVGVGLILASVVELPDGLRKVLGSVGCLAHVGNEAEWLIQVFARGGHRSLHAGIALIGLQLMKPRSLSQRQDYEAQVLQALILRHPNSVILHLMTSFQRRRHGDPHGALDAISAAKRAWLNPKSTMGCSRPPNSQLPPAVKMASADAHLAALQYQDAAREYRSVLDHSHVIGLPLEFQGRATIRLAGAMTLMGLQKWPSKPWGFADEWILRSVVAARSNRLEEEAVAGIAARFSSSSHLRPLLPFWLLFLMGDLESLGSVQRVEIVNLLRKLGHNNPSVPPKEDFMAYAEGKALWRLLLGSALRAHNPGEAKKLWCDTLCDSSLGSDSIAVAYTQCLLGEEEVKSEERLDLGVRLLVKGSQLPGDRTLQLRLRYGAALQSLPFEMVEGMLPQSWALVLGAFGEEDEGTECDDSRSGSDAQVLEKRPSGATALMWLGPVMQQRNATRGMVSSLLDKLHTSATVPPSLQRSVLNWKRPANVPITSPGSKRRWTRSGSPGHSRRSSVRSSRRLSSSPTPAVASKLVSPDVHPKTTPGDMSSFNSKLARDPTQELLQAVQEALV